MDKLILDVLQYSRASKSELTLVPVDAMALLRGIIESYPAFHSPSVDIQIRDSLPHVLGNEAVLTQCFSNLLSNAIKFVAPGTLPRVRVWAELLPMPLAYAAPPGSALPPPAANHTQVVRVWFEDNGIGIPKEMHGRVFKLFNRLDQTTTVPASVGRRPQGRRADGRQSGCGSEPGQGAFWWS